MAKVSTNVYSLEIPEKWETESSTEGVVSIFDPNGKGAITISSYSSSGDAQDAVGVLEKFVREKGIIKRKSTSKFDIAESEYEDLSGSNITFMYVAAVCKHNQLLLISYNCKKENFSLDELDTAKKIIETLVFNIK